MSEPIRVRFTEEMKGYVGFGIEDPEEGLAVGKHDDTRFMFHLTIETDDIERFYHEPEHAGTAAGWIASDQLGGRLSVDEGRFNLFVDTGTAGQREMRYRLFFADGVGNPLTFIGVKRVEDHRGFDVWRDTSTLYSTIVQGHTSAPDPNHAKIVAAGVLRILKRDFAKQLTTFRTSGPDWPARRRGFAMFMGLFGISLFDVYIAGEDDDG